MIAKVHGSIDISSKTTSSNLLTVCDALRSNEYANILRSRTEAENKGVSSKSSSCINTHYFDLRNQ